MKLHRFVAALGLVLALLPVKVLGQNVEPDGLLFPSKKIKTWVITGLRGKPHSVGVAIPARLLHQLPEHMHEWILPLAKSPHLPFTHVSLMWEPHGHEPPGVYDLPHFDVHFNIISDQVRRSITCQGADAARCLKQPSPEELPANYAPTPEGVPQMGWHWVDLLAPELNGGTFTSTMVYGYYDGNLAFLEPMITRDFLLTKPHFRAAIRQPQVYPQPGYYPTGYKVRYRHLWDRYEVSLTDFVYRK